MKITRLSCAKRLYHRRTSMRDRLVWWAQGTRFRSSHEKVHFLGVLAYRKA